MHKLKQHGWEGLTQVPSPPLCRGRSPSWQGENKELCQAYYVSLEDQVCTGLLDSCCPTGIWRNKESATLGLLGPTIPFCSLQHRCSPKVSLGEETAPVSTDRELDIQWRKLDNSLQSGPTRQQPGLDPSHLFTVPKEAGD